MRKVQEKKPQNKGKTKTKLPYVFIREEMDENVSAFDMNFFSKVRNALKYWDEESGRAFKREQLRLRKERENRSGLQITCSNFMDSIYEKLVGKRDKDVMNRIIDAQIDSKFNPVLNEVLSAKSFELNITVKEINPNYTKYTNKVPIRIEASCRRESEL